MVERGGSRDEVANVGFEGVGKLQVGRAHVVSYFEVVFWDLYRIP